MKKDKADYVVILEHEGGKGWARKDNKFALFNSDGDAIKSGSTRTLGNAVKDACNSLRRDWESNNAGRDQSSPRTDVNEVKSEPVSKSPNAGSQPTTETALISDFTTVAIKSSPEGADITIDGKFVGTTPSTLQLTPGEHTVVVEKSGFKAWQRSMTVNRGGIVTLDANLNKLP
jgi:hypothetical protein